jgi:RNA polymerase sigma factor (sigma-70 family)
VKSTDALSRPVAPVKANTTPPWRRPEEAEPSATLDRALEPAIGSKRRCLTDHDESRIVMRRVEVNPSVGICPRTPSSPPRPLPFEEHTLIVAHNADERSARDAAWRIRRALGPPARADGGTGAKRVAKTVAIVAAVAINAARTIATIPAGGVTDRGPDRSKGVIDTTPGERGTARERFEALYRSSRDDVYAYVATLLGDRATAEDVTALAFERAYRRRATFDRHRGEERGWLFGIARNAALDELRRRRRVATLWSDPDEVTVEDDAEVSLRRTVVRTALVGLPAREREIVALKFHAGLRNTEIAHVLGVSESAAGTLLYRAMQKLREACDATS